VCENYWCISTLGGGSGRNLVFCPRKIMMLSCSCRQAGGGTW
jgi:hypothetical protein